MRILAKLAEVAGVDEFGPTTKTIPIHEAKTRLSMLLAEVQRGGDCLLAGG